jgi:hypothetical protein
MLAELFVSHIIYIKKKRQKKLEKSDKIGKKRTFLSVMLIVAAKKNYFKDEIRATFRLAKLNLLSCL